MGRRFKIFYFRKRYKKFKFFYNILLLSLTDLEKVKKKIKKEYKEYVASYKAFKRGIDLKIKRWKGIIKIIFLYHKLRKRYIWALMMYVLSFGLKIKREKNVYVDDYSGRLYYQSYEILRSKPDIFIYTKSGFKLNKKYEKYEISEFFLLVNIFKIKFFENSKIARVVRLKWQNTTATWSYRKLPQKRFTRKTFSRLMQAWGNYGKFEVFRFKKKKFFLDRELVMVGGIEYFKKKKNTLEKNRMRYDRQVFHPMPVFKRRIRKKMHTITTKWLIAGYMMLEKRNYINIKKTRLVAATIRNNVISLNNSKFVGHPFHLVTPSTLPILFSVGMFLPMITFVGLIGSNNWYTDFGVPFTHIYVFGFFFSIILTWILEIYSEEQSGAHTIEVQRGFQYAILLFILSELMLFFSFFWAYFHFSLNSNSFTGGSFTPKGVVPFFWFRIPLLNTFLLLASGISLSIAHIFVVESDKFGKLFMWLSILSHTKAAKSFIRKNKNSKKLAISRKKKKYSMNFYKFLKKLHFIALRYLGLKRKNWFTKTAYYRAYAHVHRIGRVAQDSQINLSKSYVVKYNNTPRNSTWQSNFWLLDTVIKGFVFLIYQAYEYTSCMFSINDSVYGAVFFSLTGLHGIHVFIGVFFLFTSMIVSLRKEFGRIMGRIVSFRKKFYHYYDRGAQQKNCYNLKVWTHRIAFDGSAWYWHFVDVVWFFVFVFIYWWGYSIA